jgi:hypothetical protein
MDAFALPLVIFTAFMLWLLVELIRGSISDPVPRRAGVTWAATCPAAGLLFGIGITPLAVIVGVVSMLALGSLAMWFLGDELGDDDSDDPPEQPVAPDPGPSDDVEPEPELVVERELPSEPDLVQEWDEFDREREEWEREKTPAPAPERLPTGV